MSIIVDRWDRGEIPPFSNRGETPRSAPTRQLRPCIIPTTTSSSWFLQTLRSISIPSIQLQRVRHLWILLAFRHHHPFPSRRRRGFRLDHALPVFPLEVILGLSGTAKRAGPSAEDEGGQEDETADGDWDGDGSRGWPAGVRDRECRVGEGGREGGE